MGWVFFFLNLRGNRICVREKAAWTGLDAAGEGAWGALPSQSTAVSLASVLRLEKAEKMELHGGGEGWGPVLQGGDTEELRAMPAGRARTAPCHRPRAAGTGSRRSYAAGDKGLMEQEDLQLLLVGSCTISSCWVNFWPVRKSV